MATGGALKPSKFGGANVDGPPSPALKHSKKIVIKEPQGHPAAGDAQNSPAKKRVGEPQAVDGAL